MGRKIRYKAWDRVNKVMYTAEQFMDMAGFSMWLEKAHVDNPVMIPIEFIGLHDINGNDIYEGDIVKAIAFGEVGRTGEALPVIGVVEWDSGDAGFFISTNTDMYPHVKFWNATIFEIIGNIYQNPELLEKV